MALLTFAFIIGLFQDRIPDVVRESVRNRDAASFEAVAKVEGNRFVDGSTPLLVAVRARWEAEARKLIEQGADVNVRDAEGLTPLMEAARNHDLATIQLLIARGAIVNDVDREKLTPLHHAVDAVFYDFGDPDAYDIEACNTIELLNKAGADLEARAQMFEERTPLIFALWNGHEKAALTLIRLGARVDNTDYRRRTPLMYTAKLWKPKDVMDAILAKNPPLSYFDALNLGRRGDAVRLAKELTPGQGVGIHDESPLSAAASVGDLQLVKLLLRDGLADPNFQSGWSALHWATGIDARIAQAGYIRYDYKPSPHRLAIMQMLLEAGFSPNIVPEDVPWKPSISALELAIRGGPVEMVDLLLRGGGDPNLCRILDFYEPSDWVPNKRPKGEYERCIDLCIQHGLRVPMTLSAQPAKMARTEAIVRLLEKSKRRFAPGTHSTLGGFEPVMLARLVKIGADVNQGRGEPLYDAAERGSLPAVKWLLEHGADPLLVPHQTKGAIFIARKNGHDRVAKLIEGWSKKRM